MLCRPVGLESVVIFDNDDGEKDGTLDTGLLVAVEDMDERGNDDLDEVLESLDPPSLAFDSLADDVPVLWVPDAERGEMSFHTDSLSPSLASEGCAIPRASPKFNFSIDFAIDERSVDDNGFVFPFVLTRLSRSRDMAFCPPPKTFTAEICGSPCGAREGRSGY